MEAVLPARLVPTASADPEAAVTLPGAADLNPAGDEFKEAAPHGRLENSTGTVVVMAAFVPLCSVPATVMVA